MSDPDKTGAFHPDGSHESEHSVVAQPHHVGRYRVERILGKGGFGLVYLAHDDQLQRLVAIKVPHPHRVSNTEDAEAYLAEARTVAGLDHPNIVPVHDVGSTDDCPCFIVTKFIEGNTLAQRAKDHRLTFGEAAGLVATVAEALHYAHRKGLVHRDVKPGNILIDVTGKPFVVDFGLALREENLGHGPKYAGTPAYMSPEQARGEGHRVDGRSDLFSLGVVFYELLVGRRPFKADAQADLLELITTFEPRPPRQYDDGIPKELERICLKSLSKRASDRYTTGRDMADDLRHFLAKASAEEKSTTTGREKHEAEIVTPVLSPVPTPSDPQPVKIVPKGLRSFDAHDADFFLELLPGPRDRDGLPDSIRFWKTRIEETDADNTFTVGLIYGPSGCGKSSLVKAGLLPRVAKSVIAVYVVVTGDETESRLLKALQRRVPDLPTNLGLVESLSALRRGGFLASSQKVLLVLDQFEQWLHAKQNRENTGLVQALRHCDGGRLQCIVLVRDDFWLAVSRFMTALEVELLQGKNMALVDLFDPRHAKKVLAAFGRAFGTLPERAGDLLKGEEAFLDQAASSLAQEGKVISVRLALFAEMVKGKPWTPATLKEVGGTEGVGVTFLEETFATSTAPPQHRLHQKAAQAVLKALLPDVGTNIKGNMRSQQELLETSGYAAQPTNFDALLRILDGELRLITPTDPEGKEESSTLSSQPGQKYYQLTHDYLVPSLRDWLTRKQKETRRGRAELLLADRAGVWNARPENRQLPSLLQWFSISWLTMKKNWTPPQRKMMRKARRYHAVRCVFVTLILFLIGLGGWEGYGRLEARRLRDRLLGSPTLDVPRVVEEMAAYRRWVNPFLHDAYAQSEKEKDPRKQLHASLALLPVDPGQVNYLKGRLLLGEAQEIVVIRQALMDHKVELTEELWTVLVNPKEDQARRFRAACALAVYAPNDRRWEQVSGDVAATLVIQSPFTIDQWRDALKKTAPWLIPPLARFLVDESRGISERGLIASVYGKYAADVPDAFAQLEKELGEESPANAKPEAREILAKKKASLGVALLVMGKGEKVWPLLKHSHDPTVRSYLIERLGPGRVDPNVLLDQLKNETDVSRKRALLLALGEFGLDRVSVAERRNHLHWLRDLYRDNPDPGIHGATEWLLRKWQTHDEMKECEKRLSISEGAGKQWYVNGQGHKMVVVPRPGEFLMGSPLSEQGRDKRDEAQQLTRIDWSFAIATKHVTVEQFHKFRKDQEPFKDYAPTDDCPMNNVSWYDAAAYCNWLSEEEGIPKDQQCYVPTQGRYEEGMTIAANYLKLKGYRLPTEAEWEYACRAVAETAYSFGEPVDLLGRYGWFDGNSLGKSHPVGLMKPNDLGLFDMHGNVWQWSQDVYARNSKEESDQDGNVIVHKDCRVLRGGSFINRTPHLRCAIRVNDGLPATRRVDFGFRLARAVIP